MNYWLMKTEPDTFSIEDLLNCPQSISMWEGVRNYQARNFMREMKVGDRVMIYHSSCAVPGIAGFAEVCRTAYPDPTAFDPESSYYDPKSSSEKPRWFCVDVQWRFTLDEVIPLSTLKSDPLLSDMLLVKRNRLSVMPVTAAEWKHIQSHYL
ncbi:EVE domain-containing protein [Hahella sp. CCB-MM4]|uniref:EVE domain-containing protein n=1 Tax=Hahella sp. (strain CCB-MM4) TaxID=1926491 RepID=UPI000B9B1D4D|nr:EVE domain-containing protein [Hahella sp. CCB-MM4]OZG75047.1 EVE domain-containing protein [Hahella sp. CCB-MM4]